MTQGQPAPHVSLMLETPNPLSGTTNDRPTAARATAWSGIDVLVRQGGNFLFVIVLARILAPEDFGIIALITFFSNLVIAVVQGGLSTALIQRAALSKAEESAAFWWGLMVSSIVAAALVIAGPAIARYYAYPAMSPLMAVAAAQIILSATVSVQSALLARELRFAILAKAGVVSTSISGLLAIMAAVMGAGIWSLALQLGAAAALNAVIVWRLSSWRPSFHFSVGTLKPLLGFTGYLSVSSFLEVLYSQGFALIVGKRYGPNELGLYTRAMALQLVPSSAMTLIIGRVALPLFAEQAGDQRSLLVSFRRVSAFAMLLNVPVMCGMAVLSDLILAALYGDKWVSAAPILTILSVGGVFMPVHAINLQLLLSQGRADAFFWIEVAKKVVGIFCIIIGSFYGLMGIAYGMVAAAFLALFLNTFMTKRTLRYGLIHQLVDLAGIFACAGVMVLSMLAVRSMISLPLAWSLLLLVVVGGATYLCACAALGLSSFRDVVGLFASLLKRRNAEPI